jgi:hypothetical protein
MIAVGIAATDNDQSEFGHKQTAVVASQFTSKPMSNGTALLRAVISQLALH